MAFAQLQDLTVPGTVAGLDLAALEGEALALVGLPPADATRLLETIAGLHDAGAGDIVLAGTSVAPLDADERDIAMVLHDLALYDHLDARGNIASPLHAQGAAQREIDERVGDLMQLLGIGPLAESHPEELTYADQIRVALGRALAKLPRLLLLDDPLVRLGDAERHDLRAMLRRIQRAFGVTTLLAARNSDDAMALADRIAVFHDKRLQQLDTPLHLYRNPNHQSVAEALGTPPINLLPAHYDGFALRLGEQIVEAPGLLEHEDSLGDIVLGIRAEDFDAAGSPRNTLTAILDPSSRQVLGSASLVDASVEGYNVVVSVAGHPVEVSRRAWAPADRFLCFSPRDGTRLR